MAADRVITGAIAIIRVKGQAIGKMRGITVTENVQRAEVRGLGSIVPSEIPATAWSGTVRCDFYNIDFSKSQIPGAIVRANVSLQEWMDTVCLQEDGVTLDIYRRYSDIGPDPVTGVIAAKEKIYAQIQGMYLNNESFDLNEGQVSGRNQSFQYLNPIRVNT